MTQWRKDELVRNYSRVSIGIGTLFLFALFAAFGGEATFAELMRW